MGDGRMNEVAVGLVLPVLYIVLCGVKQQVVYSPWLSEVPIIVIGGFALGKILQETASASASAWPACAAWAAAFTKTAVFDGLKELITASDTLLLRHPTV